MCCVAVIAVWLAALTVCDLRRHRLPNVLTLPGAVTVVAGAALAGRGLPAMVGAIALGGGYLLVHACAPTGMGSWIPMETMDLMGLWDHTGKRKGVSMR